MSNTIEDLSPLSVQNITSGNYWETWTCFLHLLAQQILHRSVRGVLMKVRQCFDSGYPNGLMSGAAAAFPRRKPTVTPSYEKAVMYSRQALNALSTRAMLEALAESLACLGELSLYAHDGPFIQACAFALKTAATDPGAAERMLDKLLEAYQNNRQQYSAMLADTARIDGEQLDRQAAANNGCLCGATDIQGYPVGCRKHR